VATLALASASGGATAAATTESAATAGGTVTPSGTYRTSFAIPVPPAPGAPSISLDYDSAGGLGIAGVGWDLSVGWPTLIARDTRFGTPSWTYDSKWVWGDAPLVARSSCPGPADCYRAAPDSLADVRIDVRSTSPYATASLPNGVVLTYSPIRYDGVTYPTAPPGFETNVFGFLLKQVKTPNGYLTCFVHTHHPNNVSAGRAPVLSEIWYGPALKDCDNRPAAKMLHRVAFEYVDPTAANHGYFAPVSYRYGTPVSFNNLLRKIVVYAAGETAQVEQPSYSLEHESAARVETRMPRLEQVVQETPAAGPLAQPQQQRRVIRRFSYGSRHREYGQAQILDLGQNSHEYMDSLAGSGTRPVRTRSLLQPLYTLFSGGDDQPNPNAPPSTVVDAQWGMSDWNGDGLLDTMLAAERGVDGPRDCSATGPGWPTFEKCATPGPRPPQQWVLVNEGVRNGTLGTSKVVLDTSADDLEKKRPTSDWFWLEGQGMTRTGMPTSVMSPEIRDGGRCPPFAPGDDTRKWPILPDGSWNGFQESIWTRLAEIVASKSTISFADSVRKAVVGSYIPNDSVTAALSNWLDWNADGVVDWVVSPGMQPRSHGMFACDPRFDDPATGAVDTTWHVADGSTNPPVDASGRATYAAKTTGGPGGPVPLPISFSLDSGQAADWGLTIPVGSIVTSSVATMLGGPSTATNGVASWGAQALARAKDEAASYASSIASQSALGGLAKLAVVAASGSPGQLARAGGNFIASNFAVGIDVTLKNPGRRARNQSRAELVDVNADGRPDYLLYDSVGLLGPARAGAALLYVNNGKGFDAPKQVNAGFGYARMPDQAKLDQRADDAIAHATRSELIWLPMCALGHLMPIVDPFISPVVKFGAYIAGCGGLTTETVAAGVDAVAAGNTDGWFLAGSTDALPGEKSHPTEATVLGGTIGALVAPAWLSAVGAAELGAMSMHAAKTARLTARAVKRLAFPSRLNAFSKGSSFTKGGWFVNGDGGISAQTVGLLDLNGDALPDQVITQDREKHCGVDQWAVYWGTGTANLAAGRAFTPSPTCIDVPPSPAPVKGEYATMPLQVDFSTISGGPAITKTKTFSFVTLLDHNHDGRPDLVVVDAASFDPTATRRDWRIYLNNGRGFEVTRPPIVVSSVGATTPNVERPAFVDVLDAADNAEGSRTLDVAYPGLKSAVTGQEFGSNSIDAAFLDIDGDGTADVAQRVQYGTETDGEERSGAGIMYWSRAGDAPQDLLVEERDPIAGSRTHVSYAPASHFQWPNGVPTGQRPPGGHRAGVGSPAYLVNSITSQPFIGRAERRTSVGYDYKDPHFASEGRTFSGFGRVSQRPLDPETGKPVASSTSTVSYSSQGDHGRGGVTLTRTVDESTGAPVSETFTTYVDRASATSATTEAYFSAPADTIGVEFPHDLTKPALIDVGFDGRSPLGNRADRDMPEPTTSGDIAPANEILSDAKLPTGGGAYFGAQRWVSYASPHPQSSQTNGALGAVTVEAWLRPNGSAGRGTVARLGNAYELTIEPSGAVAFAVNAGGWTRLTGTQLPILRWSHVAASYDGSKLRIFVDGALKGDVAVTGSLPAAGKLEVGCSYDAVSKSRVACYEGAIGELRVYREAWLQPARVTRSRAEYELGSSDLHFGLPLATWNYGDISIGDDDVYEKTTYAAPQAGSAVRDAVATKTRRELNDENPDAYLGYAQTRYDGLAIGQVGAGNPTSSSVYSGALPTNQTPTADTTTKTRYTDPACPGIASEIEDPEGAVAKTRYDATCAFALSTTNALGHTAATEYFGVNGVGYSDSQRNLAGLYGQPKATIDANGATTRTGYDEWGRPVASFGPLHTGLKPEVATSYRDPQCTDAQGTSVSCADADARVAEPARTKVETWDETRRAYRVVHTFADGQVQTEAVKQGAPAWIVSGTSDFDVLGRQIRAYKQRYLPSSCAAGSWCDPKQIKSGSRHVQTAYDGRGRVVRAYGPDVPICADLTAAACDAVARQAGGKFTQFEFPAPGVTRTFDARGVPSVVRRDARGLVKAAEEYTKASSSPYSVASYEYDRDGRTKAITDSAGNTIATTYDALGRKTATTDPDLGSWKYTYDKLGRLLEQRDARGAVTKHDYDLLGRVTRTELQTPPRVVPNYRTYTFDGAVDDSDATTPISADPLWHRGKQVENQKQLISAPYNWEPAQLTPLPLAAGNTDDGVARFSLPFDFALTPKQMWAPPVTEPNVIPNGAATLFPSGTPLYVSTNGKIRFNTGSPGGALPIDNGHPRGQLPVNSQEIAVYPLFNDLVLRGGISWTVTGNAPNRRLIVEWDAEFKFAAGPTQFRAVFHETTHEIEFQYAKLPFIGRGDSVVGFQNLSSPDSQPVGVQWQSPLTAGIGLTSRRVYSNVALAFNNGTSYGVGRHVMASARFEIDLRDATSATVSFRHSWNTRCAQYARGTCPVDLMRVRVKALKSVGDVSATLLDTAALTAHGFNAATSSLSGAPLLTAPLPKWAMGERVMLLFEFDTVNGTNEPRYGWLVDDIRVSKSFQAVEEIVTREYDSAELASDLRDSKPIVDLTFDVPSRIEDRSPSRAEVQAFGVQRTQGASGRGTLLDGTTAWLRVATGPEAVQQELTAEAWVKPADLTGRGAIVQKPETFALTRRAGGALHCWVRAGGDLVEALGATVIPTDVWTHVAMTFDGMTVRCYVNGVEDGAGTAAAPSAPPEEEPGPVLSENSAPAEEMVEETPQPASSEPKALDWNGNPILVGSTGFKGLFAGSVDEVRVFAKTLAVAELLDHAQSPLRPGPPRGNSLDLRFGDPAKPEADSSGADNDATMPVAAEQRPGIQGNALDLSSAGSHVEVETSPSLQSDLLTAEVWTKLKTRDHKLLVGKWDTNPNTLAAEPGWRLAVNGATGRVRFEVRTVPSTPRSWAHWTGDTSGKPAFGKQSCAPAANAPAVRRRWVPPVNGKFTLSTIGGANWDTVLVVEEAGGVVACSDDDSGTKQSSVTLDFDATKTYDVYVTGSGTAAGVFTVLVSGLPTKTTEFVTKEDLDVDEWYHVAGTYDGQTLNVYIDGKRAGRWCEGEEAAGETTCTVTPSGCGDQRPANPGEGEAQPATVCGSIVNLRPVMVGAYVKGGPSLNGMVDEVRVSNYAKRDWEVAGSARLASAYTHALGRETAMRGRWASSMQRYDLLGRGVSEQKIVPLLQPAATKVIRVAYDNLSRATSRRYPDGEVTVSTFDLAGTETQLTGYGDFFADAFYGNQPYLNRVDVTATGRLEKVEYGNGVTTAVSYDDTPNPTGSFNDFLKTQITSTGATKLQDQSFTYDEVGNVIHRSDLAIESTYTYDDLSRLKTFATKRNGAVVASGSYDYDALGNLTAKEGAILSYSGGSNCGLQVPQALPHAVRSVTTGGVTTQYCYDANGSIAEIHGSGVKKLRHDARGKLSSFEGPNGAFRFDYDGNGQRVHKTGPMGRTTEVFPFFRVTPKGVEKYYFAGGRRIARRAGTKPEEVSWYHADHLGGTNVMTGADGAELRTAHSEHTPFGGELPGAANQTARDRSGGYQFTGKELDETGLYDYGARYYDPAIGRFIEADTVLPGEFPQALNRYSYVYNNPVKYVDPTGHAAEQPWWRFTEAAVAYDIRSFRHPVMEPVITYDTGYAALNLPVNVLVHGVRNSVSYVVNSVTDASQLPFDWLRDAGVSNTTVEGLEFATLMAGAYQVPALVERAALSFRAARTLGSTDDAADLARAVSRAESPSPTLGPGTGATDDIVRSLPDGYTVVRGGATPLPPPGQVFSGAAGKTLEEAASGVPHGQIRATTAGQIRANGGNVEFVPELTRSGVLNERHVNICLGKGACPFGPLEANPVPKSSRIK
jgi:RHS repeat-associated protein